MSDWSRVVNATCRRFIKADAEKIPFDQMMLGRFIRDSLIFEFLRTKRETTRARVLEAESRLRLEIQQAVDAYRADRSDANRRRMYGYHCAAAEFGYLPPSMLKRKRRRRRRIHG